MKRIKNINKYNKEVVRLDIEQQETINEMKEMVNRLASTVDVMVFGKKPDRNYSGDEWVDVIIKGKKKKKNG